MVATFVTGEADHQGQQWVYRDVVEYRPDTMEELADAAGLRLTAIDWPHPSGQRWIVLRHA
jgi:hypothetical protein